MIRITSVPKSTLGLRELSNSFSWLLCFLRKKHFLKVDLDRNRSKLGYEQVLKLCSNILVASLQLPLFLSWFFQF